MKFHRTALLILTAALSPFATAQTIELKNGTKIVGTIEKQEGGRVFINAELLGPIVVDASALVSTTAKALPPTESKKEMPVAGAAHSSSTAALSPAPDPNKVHWKRTLSINGSYTSATYSQGPIPGAPAGFPFTGAVARLQGEQSMVQLNAMFLRATATEVFSLTANYGYAKFEPQGEVMKNWGGEMSLVYFLSPRRYLFSRTTHKVDRISLVDHSFEQIFGYGFKVIKTAQDKLDVIPGVSGLHESKGTRYDDDWHTSVGMTENYEHAFNERVSLEQRFQYRVSLKDSEVWAINGNLGIRAAMTANISLNVRATYTYDNTLGPLPPTLWPLFLSRLTPAQVAALRPAKKDQLHITSGLEFAW